MRLAYVLALAPVVAQAEPDLTWQARLTGADGAAVNGTHDLRITLRDAGNTELWRRTYDDVSVSDGFVSLVLSGDDSNVPARALQGAWFLGPVFVSVALDGGADLSPAQAITSVPRAATVVGNVRLTNDATTCTSGHGGAMRWTGTAFELCDGSAWRPMVSLGGNGSIQAQAGRSCRAIHDDYPSLPSGPFWIDPTGGDTTDAFRVQCEMVENGGGWTLCLSNVNRGKGTAISDSNTWWTTNWDKGSRVLTRGNSDQGTAWGNFCPSLASSVTQVYATVYSQNNTRTAGDVCTLNTNWFTPGSGHMELACGGTTRMSAIPKSGFNTYPCTNCIYWSNENTLNTSSTPWNHNYFGTHVMVRPGGANAYGPSGIHWGYVNTGMSDPNNGGDVHCGEHSSGTWCYEPYWGSNIYKKSMQLYVR